mmetsp:Transcript_1903/g.5641  ORF Transcript_1903/g.5641 Transcript_1903/m.5641 type:complete len:273 (+) Transcript_1903:2177-2995(+)
MDPSPSATLEPQPSFMRRPQASPGDPRNAGLSVVSPAVRSPFSPAFMLMRASLSATRWRRPCPLWNPVGLQASRSPVCPAAAVWVVVAWAVAASCAAPAPASAAALASRVMYGCGKPSRGTRAASAAATSAVAASASCAAPAPARRAAVDSLVASRSGKRLCSILCSAVPPAVGGSVPHCSLGSEARLSPSGMSRGASIGCSSASDWRWLMLPRWLRGTRLPMPYAVPTGDGACAAVGEGTRSDGTRRVGLAMLIPPTLSNTHFVDLKAWYL